jgi:phage/plasmid-like protein (TIGR03299 family)
LVANIAFINGKYTYAGERPGWHNLGQDVGHAMTAAEAMEAAGLAGWDLEAKDMYVQLPDGTYVEAPDRRAIFRNLDNVILGTVGSKYTILPNEEAFEALDGLLADGAMKYATAGALGRGERVWILAKVGEDFEPLTGDVITPYMLFTAAHDGSGAARGKLVNTRVVCQNTLAVALGEGGNEFRIRHTATIKERLGQASQLLGIISKQQKRINEVFRQFAETKAEKEVQERVLNMLTPAPSGDESDTVRDRLQQERFQLWRIIEGATPAVKIANPETLWGTFNACTEWIDWLEPRKGMDADSANKPDSDPWYVRRLVYSFDGIGADRRQKVFNTLRAALPVTV